jgi:transposase InsO family protein
LKEKFEAYETFKKFKVILEENIGTYINSLKSDRNDEYLSNNLKIFCEEHEIRKFYTTPYTLHQNGVAERKNMIILDMVCSILMMKNMPNKFWTKAL